VIRHNRYKKMKKRRGGGERRVLPISKKLRIEVRKDWYVGLLNWWGRSSLMGPKEDRKVPSLEVGMVKRMLGQRRRNRIEVLNGKHGKGRGR